MGIIMTGRNCAGACGRIVTFEIETTSMGTRITAGHQHPSCDWYKEQPDSIAVAKAVGLVAQDQRSVRGDN